MKEEIEDAGSQFIYNVFTICMSWMVLFIWLGVLSYTTGPIFTTVVTFLAMVLEKHVADVNPYLA